jgi:hypothetical protein
VSWTTKNGGAGDGERQKSNGGIIRDAVETCQPARIVCWGLLILEVSGNLQ